MPIVSVCVCDGGCGKREETCHNQPPKGWRWINFSNFNFNASGQRDWHEQVLACSATCGIKAIEQALKKLFKEVTNGSE